MKPIVFRPLRAASSEDGAGRRLKEAQVLVNAMELAIAKRTTTEMLRKGPTLPISRPS